MPLPKHPPLNALRIPRHLATLATLAAVLAPPAALASGSFAPAHADLQQATVAPGEHPRLFFGPDDLAALPAFVDQHPELSATRDLILDADNRDLWVSRAQNYGYAYWLTADPTWADKARDMVLAMIADTSRWELASPRALTAGADIWSVAQAYDACAEAWQGQTVPASVTATIRTTSGMRTITRGIPAHYVGRDLREAVSEALARNSFILLYHGNGSGWPGDGKTGNNWFAWRYATPILGLLASDHADVDGWNRDTALTDALRELRKYLDSKYTSSTTARGWDPEGHGYNFYPGMVMWPAAYALKRLRGIDLVAEYPGSRYTHWTTLISTLGTGSTDFNMPIPGIHPDFSDDNSRTAFQGTAALGLAFVPDAYLGGYRFMFDRLVGPLADPQHRRYDFDHGGGMWTILFYPTTRAPEDPALAWGNSYYDPAFGMAMFRNRFADRDDVVFMATANLRGSSGGHEGLDELTFRLFGFGEPWVVGAGRTQDVRPMPHVFPLDPALSQAWPPVGTWGQRVEDIYQRGNGDGIMVMSTRLGDTGVRNHQRKLLTDYSGAGGASAFYLVHDLSDNGTWWRLPVVDNKTLAIDGDTFTFTSPDTGARLIGKVLYPENPTILTRTFTRVASERWTRANGSTAEYGKVKTIDIPNNVGEFLVALFLAAPGESIDTSALSARWDGDHWVVNAPGGDLLVDDGTIEAVNWQRPDITLDWPHDGSDFIGGPREIVLQGTASAAPGITLDRVEVWDGAQLLGQAHIEGNDWSFSLGVLPLGDYAGRFHAVAYDSDGNHRQTAAVDFTLNTSEPPVLHLGSPAPVSYNRAPGPVTIAGVAYDPDGSLADLRVYEDYNGAWMDLGQAVLNSQRGTWSFTTSYPSTHNPKPTGRHHYRIVATDDSGDIAATESAFFINRHFGGDPHAGDEANYWTDENTAFHSFVADRVDGSEVMRFRQRPEGGSSRADHANLRDRFLDFDFRVSFDARFENPERAALAFSWGSISITFSSNMPDNPPTGWPHDYLMDPTHYLNAQYVLGKKQGNPHIAIDMSYGERNLYHWPEPLVPDDQWHRYAIERHDQTLRILIDEAVVFENGPGTDMPESPYFAQAGYMAFSRMYHAFPDSVWIDNVVVEQLSGNAAPVVGIDTPSSPYGVTPPFSPVALSGTVSDDEGISFVEIWTGGTFHGHAEISGGSWTFEFTPPHFGSWALYAIAQDQRGLQAWSEPVVVHAYHPDDAVQPSFTSEPPANILAELGGNLQLQVSVTGFPLPVIQWYKDGVPLPGETATVLPLRDFHPDDRGVYSVRLTSPLMPDGLWSGACTVSAPDPRSPRILTQPVDRTVVEGLPAQFSVAADGDPVPTYQWYKNGRLIAGASGNSLNLPAATLADTGSYTVVVSNSIGTAESVPALLSVQQSAGLMSRVAYAGGGAATRFHDAVELSDGSILVAGSTANLVWLPAGVPVRELNAGNLLASGNSARGILLHLEPGLDAVRACYTLPASAADGIRRIRYTTTPGSPGAAVHISGRTAAGYFLGRLNADPDGALPNAFDWIIQVPSGEDHQEIQPWDVDALGNVVYLQGNQTTYDSNADLQPVIRFLDSSGQPRNPPALRATEPGSIRFPRDLRSWTEAQRTAVQPDGNGEIRMGGWPLDMFITHRIDDASGDPDGVNPVRVENGEPFGYTGYRSAGKHRIGGITVDRRTGAFFIGFNTSSRFWDAPAGKVQPDFEPSVVAYAADGSLLWWSRLYHEVVDANGNGLVDPGETRLSPPDQYVDGLAVDYSGDTASGDLVVLARAHGNAASNLWNGDAVALRPGEGAFHNRFSGTEGNIHVSWIGKLALGDGALRRATYLGGYFRKEIDGKGDWPTTPYAEEIHDGWPDHNAGWPDLTTTMATPNSMRVDHAGRVHVVGRGPRMVTTSNAYQKLPRRLGHSSPVLDEGTAPWHAFVRVYQPDLRTLAYSSALTGDWYYPTGDTADEPSGADNTVLNAVLPLENGLLVTGLQENAGQHVPVINPAPWQETEFTGETGLLGLLAFQPPQYHLVDYAIDPAGAGMVFGAGSYLFGSTATLSAAPSEGFRFIGWSGAAESTDTTIHLLIDADKLLTAHFEVIPPSPPLIIDQPSSVEVAEGASVTLSVVAEGYPSPSYAWFFNDNPLPGNDSPEYRVAAATRADAGVYTVRAGNSEGFVMSDPIRLSVVESPEAPSIISHPVSRVAREGGEVILAVGVSGVPAPAINWERDGVALPGATSPTLVLIASGTTAGEYRASAVNIMGEALSDTATLAVLPVAVPGRLETVVDWQGDYASGTYGLDRYQSAVVADFGDGAGDWGVRRAAFSMTDDLAPTRRYDTALTSAIFHGGVESWRHGVFDTARAEVVDSGGRDQIRLFDSNASNRHLFAALLWRKQEFLNGFEQVPLAITGSGALVAVIDLVSHGHAQARFVVESGGRFYLSAAKANSAGIFSLSHEALREAMWAPYDPAANLQPVPGQAGICQSDLLAYAVGSESLDDVTAVGLYLERFEFPNGGNPEFRMSQFTAMLESPATGHSAAEAWRQAHFADLMADPAADPQLWAWDHDADGDGLSNLGEFLLGEDPLIPVRGGPLMAMAIDPAQPDRVLIELTFPTSGSWENGVFTGDGYSVWFEAAGGLSGAGWSKAAPLQVVRDDPAIPRYRVALPFSSPRGFYRVEAAAD
jgi:hypothetical protein